MGARKREKEYHAWVSEVKAGGCWSDEDLVHYDSEWREVNKDWEHAIRISIESGFPFYDRQGNRRIEGNKPPMVAELIDLYLRQYPNHFKELREVRRGHQPSRFSGQEAQEAARCAQEATRNDRWRMSPDGGPYQDRRPADPQGRSWNQQSWGQGWSRNSWQH